MDSAGSTDPCVAPPAFAHCRDRRGSAVLIVALMAVVAAARPAASDRPLGNAVTRWNAVATEAFTPSQGTNPMAQSRRSIGRAVAEALGPVRWTSSRSTSR